MLRNVTELLIDLHETASSSELACLRGSDILAMSRRPGAGMDLCSGARRAPPHWCPLVLSRPGGAAPLRLAIPSQVCVTRGHGPNTSFIVQRSVTRTTAR